MIKHRTLALEPYGSCRKLGLAALFLLVAANIGAGINYENRYDLLSAMVPTTTTITSSANPSVFGQPVTFTITVSGAGTPTGNVQLFDGVSPIGGAVALNASGQAQVTTSSLSVGNHTISATYAGDVPNGFDPSSGNLTGNPQVVNKASTTVALTSNSSNPVGTNVPVIFRATVNPVAPGSGTRTGTVTFRRNGSPVSGCTNVGINASAQATCTITFTVAGNYNLSFSYSGDANFNGSISSTFVQQVIGPSAASVTLGGRVVSTARRGLSSVIVTVTGADGVTRTTRTNTFGYYRFADLPAGDTYFLTYNSRGYRTATSAISALDSVNDLYTVLTR